MIDKRIGKRVKQCRERLGISQEELAEKTGLTANYISTVERGMSFPRCEKLIILLNGLEVSADAIFCDVLEHSTSYKSSELSEKLASLSPQAQKRILQMVELIAYGGGQRPRLRSSAAAVRPNGHPNIGS